MPSRWREVSRPIIREVIDRVGLDDKRALRLALRDAYPFGERAYHPYKIWLDEIAIQTGRKVPAKRDSLGRLRTQKNIEQERQALIEAGQKEMFE